MLKNKSLIAERGRIIMQLAHEIRKKYPNKQWKDCVKEAGKQYKKLA